MIRYSTKPTYRLRDMHRVLGSLIRRRDDQSTILDSKYFPGKPVIPFNYARSAIIQAIKNLSLAGREVLVPAFICKELLEVFTATKTRPVFVDANPETFNMDLKLAEDCITDDTAAILAAHTFGNPFDLEGMDRLRREYGLFAIEDCAHALGGKYKDRYLGSFGDVSVFSIYKFFPTIKGGFLVVNNPDLEISDPEEKDEFLLSDVARFIYSYDLVHRTFPAAKEKGHQMITKGTAVAGPADLVQRLINHHLMFVGSETETRQELWTRYKELLKDQGVVLQRVQDHSSIAGLNFPVRVPAGERDRVFVEMMKSGVLCERLWQDCIITRKVIKERFGARTEDYPIALELAETLLNLPIQSRYTDSDIDFITSKLLKVI